MNKFIPTGGVKYPNCIVREPSKLGDGVCFDHYEYNSEDCGFDGGDCIIGRESGTTSSASFYSIDYFFIFLFTVVAMIMSW